VLNELIYFLDHQAWIEELSIINKYAREDRLQLSMVHYGLVHEVYMLRAWLRLRRQCVNANQHVGYEQVKQKTMPSYLTIRCSIILNKNTIVVIAPFELVVLAYLTPPRSPLGYSLPHSS
jgi:hypothetical protein